MMIRSRKVYSPVVWCLLLISKASTYHRPLSSLPSLCLQEYLSFYQSKDVLVVGDGDFSFSRDIASTKVCKSLIASSIDSKVLLANRFPTASSNIEEILKNNYDVLYEHDATKPDQYPASRSFDIITWNFPHIIGKQNIKHNRALLRDFFSSASSVLRKDTGKILLALTEKQSGVTVQDKMGWDYSWKLIEQLAGTDLLLTGQYDFTTIEWPTYKPTGRRGVSKIFHAGEHRLFQIEKVREDCSMKAIQVPLFTHEVPLLTSEVIINLDQFLQAVREKVICILKKHSLEEYFWSLCFVDFYAGLQGHLNQYTVEITFLSQHKPLNRENINEFRKILQSELPIALGLKQSTDLAYQHTSKAIPWFVAEIVKRREENQLSGGEGILQVKEFLKQVENGDATTIEQTKREFSNKTAQILWKDRAGLILHDSSQLLPNEKKNNF